jgi:hypothetical protein
VEPGNKKKKINLWIFAFLKRIYLGVLKARDDQKYNLLQN